MVSFTPGELPFLTKVCWQTVDISSLTPQEMLRRYERGWHYRGVLGELSAEEAAFVRELSRCYGSWIAMNFHLKQHQLVLQILSRLNVDFLKDCGTYFRGGTFLTLKYDEYRLSNDIDFLCSSGQGYRAIRQEIFDRGYDAIFTSYDSIELPREIQANQYGVRFPVFVEGVSIKFEIVMEGRITLDAPAEFDWLPVVCLSLVDCFAEKLLANADRWLDTSIESRDLIDLAMLRCSGEIPAAAMVKAENAYPVVEPLKRAIANFQSKPDYRQRCYQSLMVKSPIRIMDGIDLLADDFSL
ncbi:MAG: nucleotidyl transferase AbiEii/AbiGii toxin family protein [Stigonema ocellatum SAG 48.90 = DSM 106950]|nr:nucleotidyl transferase AbiEii/AbiGii toxin family protein [Stigonema ocellatum SAG 48.90 = DSM 106950]